MKKKLYLILAFIPFVTFGQIKVTDLTKIKSVNSITTAQNKVVFGVSAIDVSEDNAKEYDYVRNLHLLDVNTGAITELTRGKSGASQAALSPDGQSVAFVRSVKGKPQIFILPLSGGEPWQLTHSKNGASSPKFSPDGKNIVYSSSISLETMVNDSLLNPKQELPGFTLEKPGFKEDNYLFKNDKIKADPDGSIEEIRAYLNETEKDKKARVFTRLNFQGEANLNNNISFSHLYEIEVKEKAKPRALVSGFVSYMGATYSPDGKSIYSSTALDPTVHPDRSQENKIVQINLSDLSVKTIMGQENTYFRGISLSNSGQYIASITGPTGEMSYGRLCIFSTDDKEFRIYDFDRIPSGITWEKDDKTIYFTAQSNGGVPAFKMDVESGKVTRLTDFESGISNLTRLDNGDWVYAKTEVANPNELYVSNLDFTQNKRVSELNHGWLKDRKLSFPEKHIYKNSNGQDVEFWIMKPTNFQAGKKYPLLLQLHGGPSAMWGPGEGSMWHEYQYFTSQGYGIVYPNQRGSGGYGKDFQFSNYRDWGYGPQEDALGAVDFASKANWVDTSRLVITGGSYAGYLTAWIISQDHRFKAAFAQRGVYDLTTFMGEGNAWRLTPYYFGLPWEDENITKIRENSPYEHVNKIKTPFLIKHGDNDLRTGVIQSEMMFRSLKYLGVDTEYLRYKGATHELSRTGDIRQRIDRILRIHEFFERYIGK